MVARGSSDTVREFVLRCLMEGATDWSLSSDQRTTDNFLRLTREMEVQPILYSSLVSSGEREGWPEAIMPVLRAANHARFAAFELRAREVRQVCRELQRRELPFVLLKGVPLAFSLYRNPHHRPCSDTDLLIAPDSLPWVERLMADMGYVETPDILFGTLSQQKQFSRRGDGGLEHLFEFHLAVNNRPLLTPFGFDELRDIAVELAALGSGLVAPAHPESFVLAVLHRVGHLPGDRRFLWLYDLVLLADFLDEADWQDVLQWARGGRFLRVLQEGLREIRGLKVGAVPESVMAELEQALPLEREPSSYYLKSGRTRRTDLVVGWQSLPTLIARFRCLRQLCFPSRRFMMTQYEEGESLWLPALYGKRLWQALFRHRSP